MNVFDVIVALQFLQKQVTKLVSDTFDHLCVSKHRIQNSSFYINWHARKFAGVVNIRSNTKAIYSSDYSEVYESFNDIKTFNLFKPTSIS